MSLPLIPSQRLALAHQHNFSPTIYASYTTETTPNGGVFDRPQRTGKVRLSDVLDMLKRGPDAQLALHNFGEKSLDELVAKLREKGYLADV
jgi:hypothetical protein